MVSGLLSSPNPPHNAVMPASTSARIKRSGGQGRSLHAVRQGDRLATHARGADGWCRFFCAHRPTPPLTASGPCRGRRRSRARPRASRCRPATSPQSADHHDVPAPEKCQRTEVHHAAREERRWRAELAHWIVSGVTGAAAAGAAAFAGWYAKGAYEAGLRAVQEARRQADTAERQLVASTRARLKLMPVTDAYVHQAKGGERGLVQLQAYLQELWTVARRRHLFRAPHIRLWGRAFPQASL